MKTEYDPKADAMYIRLIAGTVGIRVRFQSLKATVHDKGLRQAVRAGLHRIRNSHAPLASVAQEFGKAECVLRGGDQQHPDADQHQGAQGIVDHRLVAHRHQLLAHCLLHRVKPRTRAGCGNRRNFCLSENECWKFDASCCSR